MKKRVFKFKILKKIKFSKKLKRILFLLSLFFLLLTIYFLLSSIFNNNSKNYEIIDYPNSFYLELKVTNDSSIAKEFTIEFNQNENQLYVDTTTLLVQDAIINNEYVDNKSITIVINGNTTQTIKFIKKNVVKDYSKDKNIIFVK